ncbi:MAG: DUF2124 family protein [Methanobacterium sp.]|nr:DUF2124 family protein [Methanobacterium sp.]
MGKDSEFIGITGNLLAFREEVKEAKKIAFIGMPGVCSPFAQLFAFVVKEKESVFITGTDITSAIKIIPSIQGMEFGELTEPNADYIALLGGLARPKSGIKADEIQKIVDIILEDNGKLIGLSYMDIFRQQGWDKILDFDCIINGTLNGFILRK